MFSYNQERQFYVATDSSEFVKKGNDLWLKTKNALGEAERSDLIDVKTITYANVTKADKLKRSLKKIVVNIVDEPVLGQDYILHVNVRGFVSGSDDNTYSKFGAVHVTSNIDDKQKLAEAMVASLKSNFKRDLNQFFTFKATEDSIVILELPQPWRQGWMHQVPVLFDVVPSDITLDGEEVSWTQPYNELTPINAEDADYTEYNEANGTTIKAKASNGRLVADMEWFYHGERGDMYREVNYPNNLDTKLLADPDKEYDILDIHFSYSGNGVAVQKSEKDLTIAGEASVITRLAQYLSQNVLTINVKQNGKDNGSYASSLS